MTKTDPPVWMGSQATADYLGITTRTLYRLIDDGQLTAYKIGRVIRLQLSDVDAFVEASRIEPGSLQHLYPEAGEPRASDDEDDQNDEDT